MSGDTPVSRLLPAVISGRAVLRRLALAAIAAGLAFSPARGQSPARDKVSGLILAHQALKQLPAGRTLAEHQAILRRAGLNAANTDAEDCALYVTHTLSAQEIAQFAAQGVRIVPGVWVPPVPGKHPYGFHLATVSYASLATLRADARVVQLETTEIESRPYNDVGAVMIKSDLVHAGTGVAARNGTGIKIAVADSGVDLTHADIPTPVEAYDVTTGTTISSWSTTVANKVSPHGTHVTATALGRGTLSGGKYAGAAPAASLLFYKIGDDTTASASFTNMIKAINRALAAGAKVFTMSYGGFSTYMDGSESTEQAIDAAVAAGMTVFIAAGNEAESARHYSVTVPPATTSAAFSVTLSPGSSTTYTTTQSLQVDWRDGNPGDNNLTLACTNLGTGETLTLSGSGSSARGTEVRQYSLKPNLAAQASKTYTFTLQNTATTGQSPLVHCYLLPSSGITFASPDPNYTVTAPADADGAIAVGAWVHRASWTNYQGSSFRFTNLSSANVLADFSSLGPRIDGRMKPDLVAPGAATISARDSATGLAAIDALIIDNDGANLNGSGPANYYVMQGTSMATPMAAGVAALVIEANPQLSAAQVRQVLTSTAASANSPGNSSGYGLINALAAVQAGAALAQPTLKGLSVTGPATVKEGNQAEFVATALYSDGTSAAVTAAWSLGTHTGSESIATSTGVLSGGAVTANDAIQVTASYTTGGVTWTASAPITVVNVVSNPSPTLTSVAISGPSAVAEKQSAQYAATAIFSDGSTQPVTATWAIVNNTGTVTLDASTGILTAGAVAGDTTVNITASYTSGSVTQTGNYAVKVVNLDPPVAPAITWATPASIVYGTALSATQLNATANATGTFVYNPAAGTVLPAGTGQTLRTTFTPQDSTAYTTATSSTTINVTQAPVTATVAVANKTYDGTTAATISARTLAGVVGTDDVAATGGTAVFADKTVATGKTVSITGLSLTGTTATNYQLTSTSAQAIASITAKTVQITGLTAADKNYDGTTTATIGHSSATLTGTLGNDTVSVNYANLAGVFDTANVGTGKTVSVSGLSLQGTDAANYALATPPTLTASILPDFLSWRVANFTSTQLADSTISGPDAVYAADGVPNLTKYALGLTPGQSAVGAQPTLSQSGGYWIYKYTRPASVTDVTYAIDLSTDLATWSETTQTLTGTTGGVQTWQATYPASGTTRLFFRLRIQQ